MLSLSVEKIDELFEAVSSKQNLYIPVDCETSKKANFQKWQKGLKLSERLKTVRSAKDFFFPKTENLVNYKVEGKSIKVEDPRKDVEDFVVFGVRACDAKSFEIIDNVYLHTTPVDSYYKNRREHGTIMTLACNEPEKTCFCSTYKIDAAAPSGDVSVWKDEKNYYFQANTEKGEKLLSSVKSALPESKDAEKAVDECKKEITKKIEALPFSHLDLSKFQGKDMMKIFNSKIWEKVAESCLGCGTCTYVCPTCMCFDVRDFDTGNGIKQVRCWDSCMYSDFTQMAAANPRLTQKERSRQRFMHKLVYYPMTHDGLCSCVGCGRCLESCPINMNIVKVINAFNNEENTTEGK